MRVFRSPAAAPPQNPTQPPTVTLVSTPACHLCLDAQAELASREAHGQLAVELVAAESAAGQALVAQHRPAMFPLVLLDGAFLTAGRLSRGKLDKALTKRRSVP